MNGSPSPSPTKTRSRRRRSRESSGKDKHSKTPQTWRSEKENNNVDAVLSSAWRISPSKRSSRRNKNAGSGNKDSSPDKWTKSHGISPSRFHKKNQQKLQVMTDKNVGDKNTTTSSPPSQDNDNIPAWKQTVEHNLLIQQHSQHLQLLEHRRKQFRKQTQLKMWPLQDMAMEHVDYLLGKSAGNSTKECSQFHGGDYLSSESSSSLSSIETSRPRLSNGTGQSEDGTTELESPRSTADGDDDRAEETTETTDDSPEKQQSQPQHPLWSLEPRIFAIEKAQGKRKYLVGQYGRIADWYWRKATHPKHLYEVIRESTPCRLYFDLEYSKVHNSGSDSSSDDDQNNGDGVPLDTSELLREFREELAIELKTYYGLTLQSSQIINLDSSSDSKFSRHWIVHLTEEQQEEKKEKSRDDSDDEKEESDNQNEDDNTQPREVLFRDAPTVGRFVKRLVSRLAEEIAVEEGDFADRRPTLAKYLFVNTKDANKPTCFVDLGVYTRNRLFRCLGSSKFGKTTTLQVITQEEGQNKPQYCPLSLPPNKKVDSSQSSQPLSMEEFVVANDWEPHAKALADTLVVPLRDWPRPDDDDDNPTESTRILDVEDELYGSMTAGTLLATAKGTTANSHVAKPRRAVPTISMAREGSRLPTLDKFVDEVLAARGGTLGSIRAWSVEYGPRDTPVSITYHMQRNRFCEMIGRSHKSNNIFWTVDLASWTCFQGCHDPDCYGRGSPVPIPNDDGLDAIQKEFEDWQEEDFENALAALNIDDIVAKAKESSSAEEEFENALARLDLDDIVAKAKASSSSTQPEKSEEDNFQSQDVENADGNISDEALMQAILDNPELFP